MEIHSFITRFKSLGCAGIKADLNISSENGEVLIAFNVNLGSISSSALNRHGPLRNRRRPPSYYRRQVKRRSQKVNNDVADSSKASAAVPSAADSGDAENVSQASNSHSPEGSVLTNTSGTNYENDNIFAKSNMSLSSSEAINYAESKQVAVIEEKESILTELDTASSLQSEEPEKSCCIHIHRGGTPPPDGECCFQRCRPNWTREQRAWNYGEYDLLSQPNFKPNGIVELHGQKNT